MKKMNAWNARVFSRRSVIALAAAGGVCASVGVRAQGQQPFPTRAMNIVVPMAPGGSTDYIARTVGLELSKALGQPAVIDNKAGATGAIGTQYVARSTPDGHTLLVAPSSVVVMNPLVSKVPYDPVKDLKPVGRMCLVEVIVVASKKSGFTSLGDVVNYAKKNPGKLTFGSNGVGSAFHLAGEFMQQLGDFKMLHVPYKGASLAETALLSNEIDILVTNTVSAMPHIKSGKITPLAVAWSLGRSRALPNLPLAQSTIPGYVVDTWLGLYGPAGTEDGVVNKINGVLNAYLRDPSHAEAMRDRGMEPTPGTPEDLVKYQTEEFAKWTKVTAALRAAGRLE